MKRYQARLLAAFLVVSSLTLTAAWEFYFEDELNTTTVYQIKEELPKGHLVSPSDLTPVKISYHALPVRAVTDLKQVVSKETVYPLNKGTVAVTDFFDSPDIIPNPDQMIVPIPNDWIYSLPGSLRRKDHVTIYAYRPKPVLPDTTASLTRSGSFSGLSSNNPEQQLVAGITVAYAKDSANQEVKPSNNKMQRIDATGNIAQLELILTSEQFKILEAKALEGYKFIFTYR